jgi:hypothetical protein
MWRHDDHRRGASKPEQAMAVHRTCRGGHTRRVFDRIVAPSKELLVFEVDRHLLINECVELVSDPLVDRICRLVAVQGTAVGDARR